MTLLSLLPRLSRVWRHLLAAALLCAVGGVGAAELRIGEGVVVKFGDGAELVVRDRVQVDRNVALTSSRDDSAVGPLGAAPQTPSVGAWRGFRIEKSATLLGGPVQGLSVRYGGLEGAAGLVLRTSASLSGLQLLDNLVGLRVSDGGTVTLAGVAAQRNQIGIEFDGATGSIGASSFAANVQQAVLNRVASNPITATGNWWGDATGPRDAANPSGRGDAVSSGVNYGNFLANAPLTGARLQVAGGALPFFESSTVRLELQCVNAVDYRVAEAGAFSGVSFSPLTGERAAINFALSPGDGRKTLSAQFRSSTGEIVSVDLPGGLLVDTQPPQVAINSPAPASVVNETVSVEAVASDGSGIQKVEFFVDGVLAGTDAAAPYVFSWNTLTVAEGNREIRVVATDAAGRTAAAVSQVTVARVVLPPDTQGPTLANALVGGVALVDGAVLSRPTTLTVDATDRSGVSRVEVSVDGGAPLLASGTSSYAVALGASVLVNGPRVLVIRAFDSLNNASTLTFNITVARAGPDAPRITQPAASFSTRTASLAVVGQAQPSSTVQLFLNGAPAGGPVTAGSDGSFGGALSLAAGANEIRARATDAFGTSDPSAPVVVTLDVSVPTAPSNLVGQSLASGRIRLTWSPTTDASVVGYQVYRAGAAFSSVGEATRITPTNIVAGVFEDLPNADGTYFYRVLAVNAAGTQSPLTNMVSAASDSTPPSAAVALTPLGRVDAATGRFGQGRVNVALTLTEPVLGTPYLAVVPQGGAPITVDLVRTDDTRYTGSFVIDQATQSGTANVLFSGRDLVGNRGTAVTAGATFGIDTEGPVLSSASLQPAAPIRNDTAQTVTAVFTFSEPIKAGATPEIRYLLSAQGRSPQLITGLTQVTPTTWRATFTLPADAGANGPELLSFSHQSRDNNDNLSTQVAGANRYQIYQGALPPVAVPFGLAAVARPQGKVQLSWQGVSDADAYQLYRQGPGDTQPVAVQRLAGTELLDQTPADGDWSYSVASVRRANGEESLSGASAPVTVRSSRQAPGVPQNLVLQLSGSGIRASWQAPLNSTVASYNIYRAATQSITSIDGLVPLRSNILSTAFIDAEPSATAAAYVVTALDAAGNESAISNSAYLNAELLPVGTLRVEQVGNALPVLTWTASRRGAVGYNVYVGPEASRIKLNSALVTQLSFTDTGFTAGERRYTVAAVDANGIEMPRTVLLPAVSAQLAGGLPVKRGVMNRVMVQVTNTSSAPVEQARALIRAAEIDHKSEPFSLAPNETRLVPVIVGGYDSLSSSSPITVGLESAPNEGELVRVVRTATTEVVDSALVVGLSTDAFVRGGTGKVRLSVENNSEVDVELLTALGGGQSPSNELRFRLLDGDGNVLATQPYQQVFGANVVTLPSGQTVARIAAGARYSSDEFLVSVPAAAPDRVRLQLEVDRLRYRTGSADAINIRGRGSETTVSLVDTVYVGEVTDVSPVASFGDEDIVIRGRALDRRSGAALPNSRLRLLLNQEGFERSFSVVTGADGSFAYTFKPTLTDSGIYRVAAVHPEITSRPEQRSFTINRIKATPTPYALEVPRNYAFAIPLQVTSGIGTTASNVRFALNAASQPTGVLPPGVSVQLPAPVALASRQTLNVPVTFTADANAPTTGAVVLDVLADGAGSAPVSQVRVNYRLIDAKALLVPTPSFVDAGMVKGSSALESVTITNKGILPANDLTATLLGSDGTPAPSWVQLSTPSALGSIDVGQSRTVDISFAPPQSLADGIYEFKLRVEGPNFPAQHLNVFAAVTQSGVGGIFFKAADIFTATVDRNGRLIPGLAGAQITVENEDVPSIRQIRNTDDFGEALFEGLPAGRYKYRATARNHQEVGGRLTVRPAVIVNESVFLQYNTVTVEWSVREITIQDRYDIVLNATFETDVPAAVVVIQPIGVNLPKMKPGEIFYGELTLQNFGLVRADNVQATLPSEDGFFRYEFLANPPASLEAKQRVTIPYRVTALKSLDGADTNGQASGGGCYSYSNQYRVRCNFICANGTSSTCGASASWFSVSNTTCSAGGGVGGGGGGGAGGGFGGGGWGGGGASTGLRTKGKKCVFIPDGKGEGQCR